MIYIWHQSKFRHRFKCRIVMHISVDVYGAKITPLWNAICGVPMKFDKFAYGPDHGYPYPVCKNCLRSCEDLERAA